jgi:hypothetical protein
MIALLLALLVSSPGPEPLVQAGPMDAVFVPAGWTGPIVAAPFSEVVFE